MGGLPEGCELSDDPARVDLGPGASLVQHLLAREELAGVRQIVLATADGHGLYRRFGFEPIDAERYMVGRPPPAE